MPSREIDAVRPDTHAYYVSGRFLSDFLASLERQDIGVQQLIGDLPIPRDDSRITAPRVEWGDFVEFMKRLEVALGGPARLEDCGAQIGELKPAATLRGLAGMAASPLALYRGATRWALRRAMPGIETRVIAIDENHVDIHARLRDGMHSCPQIFHFARGGARALPRILGLRDAVVDAEIEDTKAHFRITLPPSPTLWARARRLTRTLFSAGSVLHVLEAQQLELHAENAALEKAHRELSASEERYRAFADAAVDVLAELDDRGRVVFVSASIEELLGYTPDQVTGSHFRLWVQRKFHDHANALFASVSKAPARSTFPRQSVALHSAGGQKILAELSVRSFENSRGEWRLACVVRDITARGTGFEEAAESALLGQGHIGGMAKPRSGEPQDRASTSRTDSSAEPISAGPSAWSGDRIADRTVKRIVDSALIEADAGLACRELIETESLIEAICLEAALGTRRREVLIGSVSGSLPERIWVQRGLLIAGVSSLLDSACAAAAPSSEIKLSVVADSQSAASPVIDFVVDTLPKDDPNESIASIGRFSAERANGPNAEPTPDLVRLCEAMAMDVATAHDGDLIVEYREGGYTTRRLRISSAL
jgi:PAS domain S-box-containing protein